MADMKKLFEQGVYSDLTVKFGGEEIKVHKAIVCTRMDYFNKLCGEDAKFKAGQNVVELLDANTEAVRAMFKYLYTFKYHDLSNGSQDILIDPGFHFTVYCIASKYGYKDLENAVCEAFENIDSYYVVRNLDVAVVAKEMVTLFNILPSPPSRLLQRYRTFISEYNSPKVASSYKTSSEFRKAIFSSNECAKVFAQQLFSAGLLQAINLRHCSKCNRYLGAEETQCNAGAERTDHETLIEMHYVIKAPAGDQDKGEGSSDSSG